MNQSLNKERNSEEKYKKSDRGEKEYGGSEKEREIENVEKEIRLDLELCFLIIFEISFHVIS